MQHLYETSQLNFHQKKLGIRTASLVQTRRIFFMNARILNIG
jgi:hypothetical protein